MILYDVPMQTKLTLSMEKELIEKIKSYAERNHTSVSELTSKIFRGLTNGIPTNSYEKKDLPPSLQMLIGCIKRKTPLTKKQRQEEYSAYIIEKYS